MPTQAGTPVSYRADLLSFPTGRLTSDVDRAAVAVGYAGGAIFDFSVPISTPGRYAAATEVGEPRPSRRDSPREACFHICNLTDT